MAEQPDVVEEPARDPVGSGIGKDRPWRRALVSGLAVWVATKLALSAVSAISWIGTESPGLSLSAVVRKWGVQWDSTWFLDIAKQGYADTIDDAQTAFFPLYPGLIRLFTPIFLGRDWLAALFVANMALFAALVLLYRLTDEEFGPAAAGRTIFYLVAFPTGFFLTAAYNEGLFLALLLGAVYAMRRGHWWVAGLLGALASSARSGGILLVLPFCYEYLRQHGRRVRLDVLAVAVIPIGLVAVMITDNIFVHNPFAFSESQAAHWGRHLNWPWTAIVDAAGYLFGDHPGSPPFGEIWLHNLLELGTTLLLLLMVALAIVGPWRVRRDQLVLPLFGLMLIGFMISFPSVLTRDIPYPLVSTSRIGLEVFPAFMMMGRLGRYVSVDRALLAVFLAMQGILVARFLHSGWVA